MSSRLLDALFGQRANDLEVPSREITGDLLTTMGFGAGPTDAGVSVTQESAYRMSAVYRAIALLAGLGAGLPLHSYRKTSTGRERYASALIDNPHPDKPPLEIWEYVFQSLLSHGNAYLEKKRDGLRRVTELWPLHPRDIRVEVRDEWKSPLNPTGKRFTEPDGKWRTGGYFGDVLHIPGFSYDGVTGLSPVGLHRQGIGISLAAEQFAARMFSRGALIPGVIQTDAALNQDQAEELQRRWAQKTAGGDNQWRIPVLSSGGKFQPIGLPPADAQYVEIRKFEVTEIARLFGLPPHLLGDVEKSTSWGTGIEQQGMQMLTFTMDPLLVRIEQRVTKELLPAGSYVKFTRAALLRPDTATRFLAYQRALQNSWMSPDEIREMEEMDPLPDGKGKAFYYPGNLNEVGAEASEPPAGRGRRPGGHR